MKHLSISETYLSTRETAKLLNISLGTIQTMVEMGELAAWKTPGGHRRIDLKSVENYLENRRKNMDNSSEKACSLLALFKRTENIPWLKSHLNDFSMPIQLFTSVDLCEALMQSVEIKPKAIFIDYLLSPVEQMHFIHYISQYPTTNKIPLLVDAGFMHLHPGVIRLAAENAGLLKPSYYQQAKIDTEEAFEHPYIYSYPGTSQNEKEALSSDVLESILTNALLT